MNRIDKKFQLLRKNKNKAFIAYITAGDPDLEMTAKLVRVLEASGADIIELGIPFSDPLADGPTIQAASQRALKNKINLEKVFNMVNKLRNTTDIPLVFMTYCNPVLKYGLERFFRDCKASKVDGVIIPDLPDEEAKDLIKLAKRNGIKTIFLAAPTSTRKRLERIAKDSTGFIYYVSLTGVTGARRNLPRAIASKIRLIKRMTKKPVCVGFGVSTAGQAKILSKAADGVIIGSAIVKIIGEKKNLIHRVSHFSKTLAKAIHNA